MEAHAKGCKTQIVSFDVGIKNFAYCVATKEPQKHIAIQHLELVDLGAKKQNMQAVIDGVLDVLDNIVYDKLDMSLKTVVVIESQMTAAMKSVQTAINVFFKMVAKYQDFDVTTKYLSARHKLQLMQDFPEYAEIQNQITIQSSKYRQNKVDSVQFACWLLEKRERSDLVAKVRSLKKRDDVCDAALMVFYAEKTI